MKSGEFTGVGGNLTGSLCSFSRSSQHGPGHPDCALGALKATSNTPNWPMTCSICGFDVLIIDHRGQGRSGRMLPDTHRGHVVDFSDYVDDFAAFWQQESQPGPWRKRYILAHSMGGAISTLFLQRYEPQAFHAAVFCAPMFGIVLPLPAVDGAPSSRLG